MKFVSKALVAALIAISSIGMSPACAQAYPELNGKPVVDAASVIPDAEEIALNDKLLTIEKTTGRQVAVVTIPTLEGRDIESYANGLFRKYKLGNVTTNDGVLFLVAPSEHKMRIEVGRGLEPYLTDARSSDILENTVKPQFKAGNIPVGIDMGVDQIAATISPDAITRAQEVAKAEKVKSDAFWGGVGSFFSWVLTLGAGAGFLTVIAWAVTIPKRRAAKREAEAEAARIVEQDRLDDIAREKRRAQDLKDQAERVRLQDIEDKKAAAAREARRLADIQARNDMLTAMTPAARKQFLTDEQDAKDRQKQADRQRREQSRKAIAVQAAIDAKRAEERRVADEATRTRNNERRRQEDADRSSSYGSSSYGSSSSSSSYDSGSSFSGGGGDSSGGGASSSW